MNQKMIGDSRSGVLAASLIRISRRLLSNGDCDCWGKTGGGGDRLRKWCAWSKSTTPSQQMNNERGFLTQTRDQLPEKTRFLTGKEQISWPVWWMLDRIFVEVWSWIEGKACELELGPPAPHPLLGHARHAPRFPFTRARLASLPACLVSCICIISC
jgi:hypothetical protein